MKSHPLNLYAVVPADEVPALVPTCGRGVGLVRWGPFAAIVGTGPRQPKTTAAALRHDRVVRGALEACSTVLPFRLGTCLDDATEVSSVLELNALGLTEQLHRLRGRVEMGLKARLAPSPSPGGSVGIGARFFDALGSLREFAPLHTDRRERFTHRGDRSQFDGRYLINRPDVERFWSAVAALRMTFPAVPMIGSGPWAPYSFGEVVLVQDAPRPDGPTWEVGDAPN